MGVVLTDDIADDTCGFFVRFVPVILQFAHGKQDSAMHRF